MIVAMLPLMRLSSPEVRKHDISMFRIVLKFREVALVLGLCPYCHLADTYSQEDCHTRLHSEY